MVDTSESIHSAHPPLLDRIRGGIRKGSTRVKPTQLFRRLFSDSSPTATAQANAPRATSRTASYDGLRGIACLIVFNFHFLYPYTWTITHGYGAASDDKSLNYAHQLPFLCLLVRGRAMVTLFFVISGYVLSYAFLSAPTAQTEAQLGKGFSRLTSLTLRRWMRLYLPATLSMLLVMLGAFFGAFDAGHEFQETSAWLTGWSEQHPPRFSSFTRQLKDFAGMWWVWSTPFQWRLFYSEYDPHTWTIPVEFKGSMVLFALLLASAGLKHGYGYYVLFCVGEMGRRCVHWRRSRRRCSPLARVEGCKDGRQP